MSNFTLWRTVGSEGPQVTDSMCAALRPLAVDGITPRSLGEVHCVHAAFHTVPEAEHEHQPLVDTVGGLLLVASARLDNLDQLRRTLPKDHPTHTDAHALLAAYRTWGMDMVYRIRGDFSFVVWDELRRRFFGARDHMGVRPLYLASMNGTTVASTCVGGILAHPAVPRRRDDAFLTQFLRWEIDTQRTAWSSIRRVDKGEYFCLEATDERPRFHRYWTLRRAAHVRDATVDDERDLRELVEDAVSVRLRAVGPVGCEISGGLDSAIVTGLATRMLAPVAAPFGFTFSMPGHRFDEAEFGRDVADLNGLEWQTFAIGRRSWDAEDVLKRQSVVGSPLLIVRSESADRADHWVRSKGSRVLLSGNGGDSLFSLDFAQVIEACLHPVGSNASGLARDYFDPHRWPIALLRRMLSLAAPGVVASMRVAQRRLTPRPPDELSLAQFVPERPVRRTAFRDMADENWNDSWFNGYNQNLMDQNHLADAMRAIECRHPLLDVRLLEYVSDLRFRQPDRHAPYRFSQREIFADLLPPSLRVRTENSDYQFSNVIRAQSFDPSLAPLTLLNASGLLAGRGIDAVAREVLDASCDLEPWKVWLVLLALAVELWIRESGASEGLSV